MCYRVKHCFPMIVEVSLGSSAKGFTALGTQGSGASTLWLLGGLGLVGVWESAFCLC